MTKIDDANYTSIIPTAFVTAYPRTFTDIPYSSEIFEGLEAFRKKEHLPEIGEDQKIDRLAPELEARHKLIDKLLAISGATQVLELAAGLSTRGLLFSAKPLNLYAELDLEEMVEMKNKILSQIKTLPSNLRIVSGNALRLADINNAVSSFNPKKPVAVVNEGLLRYLNFDEKTQIAKNVREILSRFGGVWITCDTTSKKFLATQDKVTKPGMNKKLSSISGKNFEDNMFEDNEHAVKFFSNLGFSVEVHPFTEILDELTSPKILDYSLEETVELFGPAVVVVMRLR
jgi:O-methyltransferase involved in polyketide biosynthesis